jgi:DNA-binding NarL/FixJ family response regulator
MARHRPPPSAPSHEPIRIVLVEERALVGVGIRGVLDDEPDMEIVAEVRSADDALAITEGHPPDVFVLDIELQEPLTSAATHRLAQEAPSSGMVVVGREDDDASIMDAIEIGAMGHVSAAANPAELVAVIRRVADGEDPLKDEVSGRPDLVDRIMDGFRESFRRADELAASPLTPRELDILRHVAAGQRNRAVADQLSLSEQTVKNHLTSILHKLGVPNRTRAVTLAVREGWFALDEVAASLGGAAEEEPETPSTDKRAG